MAINVGSNLNALALQNSHAGLDDFGKALNSVLGGIGDISEGIEKRKFNKNLAEWEKKSEYERLIDEAALGYLDTGDEKYKDEMQRFQEALDSVYEPNFRLAERKGWATGYMPTSQQDLLNYQEMVKRKETEQKLQVQKEQAEAAAQKEDLSKQKEMGMKMSPNQMAQYNLALDLMDNPADRNTKARALMGALRLETGAAIASQEMLQTLSGVLNKDDLKAMLTNIIVAANPAGAEAKDLLQKSKSGKLPSVFSLGSAAAHAFLQNNIGDHEAVMRIQETLQQYMDKIDANELAKYLDTRMLNSDIENAMIAKNLTPEQAEKLYQFKNGEWKYEAPAAQKNPHGL